MRYRILSSIEGETDTNNNIAINWNNIVGQEAAVLLIMNKTSKNNNDIL